MAVVHVGVDLGQKNDYTAVVVAELEERDDECHYLVRHLRRLPLGTPYPEIVERLAGISDKLKEREHDIKMFVDATGLGQPVMDLLKGRGIPGIVPVFLTGTEKAVYVRGELRLGKAVLVSRLQVLLSYKRIHLPNVPEAAALATELLNYEVRVSDAGHASFGAFKTGAHDDLATALGLAVWEEKRRFGGRLGWVYLEAGRDGRTRFRRTTPKPKTRPEPEPEPEQLADEVVTLKYTGGRSFMFNEGDWSWNVMPGSERPFPKPIAAALMKRIPELEVVG